MTKLDVYIMGIFIIKIVFIILAVTHVYLKAKGKDNSELDNKILFWKERIEFIFIVLMSILLMYTFFPRRQIPIPIDYEMKLLFFLFGLILIITAKWEVFIEESPTYIKLHNRHKTK